MASSNNIVDMVSRVVIEHFEGAVKQLNAEAAAIRERADTAIVETVARIEAEGRERVDSVIGNLPSAPIFGEPLEGELVDFDPIGWFKRQARSRAWRTLLQGLLAVVVMAGGNVVIQAVQQGSLNVFSWDDWKVAATLAGSATLAAVFSYLQNALGIKPPKAD